jgi:glycosyltransferase involved in cell wall biosynthesis
MKILHIGSLNSDKNNIGVINQLEYERISSIKTGINLDTIIYCSEKLLPNNFINKNPRFFKKFILRRLYYLYKIIKYSKYYDVILFRYPIADLFFCVFLYSRRAKLYSVHHTNEQRYLFTKHKGIFKYFLYLIEFISSKILLRRIDGVIGVTNEIAKLQVVRSGSSIKSTIYPNGIFFSSIIPKKIGIGRKQIVFLNTEFQKWQGLEELFESLLLNINLSSSYSLHIIGKLTKEQKNYAQLLERRGINLKHTSNIPEDMLGNFLNNFDLGLAAFYMDRIGLNEACTLKVRQYLNAGLPVYSGHIDSALPKDYIFYKIGKPDIRLILDFIDLNVGVNNIDVQSSAKEYIDKSIHLKKLYGWLERNG